MFGFCNMIEGGRKKLLTQLLTSDYKFPGITYTQSGNLTYFDSTGTLQTAAVDTMVRDYDPSTLVLRGYPFWQASTNLCLWSEDLTNAAWTKTNCTITSNSTVAPDGTTTADTIVPAASSAFHGVLQTATVTASAAYTASAFIKAGGAPFVQIAFDDGSSNGAFMNVNTATGAITRGPEAAGTGTAPTGGVQACQSGYFRINVGATKGTTNGRIIISPLPAGQSLAGMNPTVTTAASDTVIAWGIGIE